MQTSKIEEDVKSLVENFSEKDFIFNFLLTFGFTKMTIKRLREGNSNLSSKENQLIIKKKLFYEYCPNDHLYSTIDDLKNDSTTYTHKPRFIIVQNDKKLLAIDTKTNETLDAELTELHKHVDFFLPWTGKEKYIAHQENPADVKAAEKMAKIYDEIVHLNPELLKKDKNHSLNVFLTRLLFCFFAEDTGIFEDNLFSKTIVNHTNEDGNDLADVLAILFESLDKNDKEKASYPSYIQAFPYVNGKLFAQKADIPILNSKVRKLMIECGGQDWKEINPDIFGSMFQAVSVAEVRSGLGQHYTSVPNIMKVIEPLFLNDLREEYEKADTEKKLRKLLDRIYNIKIFDPACGSGNFLIIAYKQLRLLEMDIIQKIQTLPGQHPFMMSQLQLQQFYGIEIDDFACEIATLSLWLAEHQMNRKFKELFGDCKPSLPLSKSGNIVCGNATRLDWEEICPKGVKGITKKEMEQKTLFELQNTKQLELQGTEYEIYILGNPPYKGFKYQDDMQKSDIQYIFNGVFSSYKKLDYIACWFYKATNYILGFNAKYSFVSTNSITQGEQISLLWKPILSFNVEICFAYESFKWTNNAKKNAGVICVIIGVCNKHLNTNKILYSNGSKKIVKNIFPDLTDKSSIIIDKHSKPISKLPSMLLGSLPADGGALILTKDEKQSFEQKYPNLSFLVKGFIGSSEYIRGIERYCFWIDETNREIAQQNEYIRERLELCSKARLKSDKKETQQKAKTPYLFSEIRYKNENAILLPVTSSERREYIPVGYIQAGKVIYHSAVAIYGAEPWVFGVVTSRMHMVWVKAVAGRLKTDYRYSVTLCYNTFPFPDITDKQKKNIEYYVNNILAEREKHSDKTMAELYDPDKMPQGLRDAHHSLDLAIEKCYRSTPFENDEKRLEYLFKLYEIMTNPDKKLSTEEQLSLL